MWGKNLSGSLHQSKLPAVF